MKVESFWARVDVRGPDECWPWLLSVTDAGYGQLRVGSVTDGTRRKALAHRVACEMAHGPAPEGKPFALHARRCTRRDCCNPAHLRWGTPQENMGDRVAICAKGAKLTPLEALAVKRSDESVAVTAKKFNVSTTTVRRIRSGARWRHIS